MNPSRLRRSLFVLAMVGAPIAAPQVLAAQQKHGDVNGDGVVSALDAQAILTAVVGLPLPAGFVIANGDADCTTTTVALDAQIVLSFVIGLDVSQYCVNQAFGPAGVTVRILAGTAAVPDTALLINRGIWLRATLRDAGGFDIQRPIAWSTSTPDLVSLDTIRSDSVFVKAKAQAGGATVTANTDGVAASMVIRVASSFAGIVIQPQRSDTLRQLNAPFTFTARVRDSVGAVSSFQTAFWTIADTNIATVSPATAASSATVTSKTNGTTYVVATSSASPTVKDSVRLVVALPPVNSCTASTGTLHPTATFTTPQTWLASTNPHFVTGTLTFNSGAQLTIGPGTLVCLSSGVQLSFNAGSRLMARGKPDSLITLTGSTPTTQWSGIQLGNVFGYAAGAPLDTSWITNALLERGGSSQGISGREQHALVMDSVLVRQFVSSGVRVYGPGSRLSRSTVDTLTSSSGIAVVAGRGVVEFTTIRSGSASIGVALTDTATIRNVTIVGGATAISQTCCTDSARVNDVTISGTTGVALHLDYALRSTSANVQVSSGTGGAFRGNIANLGFLFADSLKQQTLKNNGKDTLFITGGTLRGATLVARPDLPWVVEAFTYIDTLAQLAPRPDSRFSFSNAGFVFQSGGTLNAVGEANKFIRFGPRGATTFYGLRFDAPGPGPNPATAPTAISTLTYVRVDSAAGQGVNTTTMCCYNAAVNGATRHRLLMDSIVVRKSVNAAIAMAAGGSYLKRGVIDTTGNVGTGYTTNHPALVAGDTTTVENTLVRRSGYVGIYAPRHRALFTNVRVVASQNVALQLDVNAMDPASTNVRADSANAYPFYGRIDNFGVIANTGALQTTNLLGNVDNVALIVGGTLSNRTVEVNPALRWQVSQSPNIDTLGVLQPLPGADITFTDGVLHFSRGGTLNAVGTNTSFIRFRPVAGNQWSGLRFDDPGAGSGGAGTWPYAVSTLTYVQVDSAAGTGVVNNPMCCYSAAISGGQRHRLLMDSVIVRKAHNAAIQMSASGSYLKRSLIDTTGTVGSNYSTTHPALIAGDTTTVENTLIRRSGYAGVYAPRHRTLFTNLRIVASRDVAIWVVGFGLDPASTNVRADSANAYPFYGRIENFGIIANTGALQTTNLLGNTDNVAHIVGGTLSNRTVEVIPALRWQVSQSPNIDTLGVLQPLPGANITFTDGILHFTRGGTLNAVGTNTNFIRFRPVAGNQWSGLRFDDPGAGGGGAGTWPYAVSTLTYVQVDSAAGTGVVSNPMCCYSAAISGGQRHRLLMDSVIVRKAHNAAIQMSASGSYLKRGLIDTTGNVASNYSTTHPALIAGDTTTVENTLVRRSGYVGLYAPRHRTLLTNVRLVASRDVGIWVDGFTLDPASTNVKADSANAYPFYGRIQNFGIIANTAALQNSNLLGNTDNVAYIAGGTLTNQTVQVSSQLRWHVTQGPVVDTLATLQPQPGADITFADGILQFARGGTLSAVGTAGNFIRFRPAGASNWTGLRFDDPGSGSGSPTSYPVAISILTYVRIDSASGTGSTGTKICCYSAAINGGSRHRLLLDSIIVRKSHNAAVSLSASGSYLRRSTIDTTGSVSSGYQTNQAAVSVADSIELSTSVIRRSGHDGVALQGFNLTLDSVRVVNSRLDGFALYRASTTYSGNNGVDAIVADSSGGSGFAIHASNITLEKCVATRGLTATSHGAATTSSHQNVVVRNCDFLNNGGNGVNNATTTAIYVILADDNYWGDPGGPDTGDGRSANVTVNNFCTGGTCTDPSFMPLTQLPGAPAIPPRSVDSRSILRSRRRRSVLPRTVN